MTDLDATLRGLLGYNLKRANSAFMYGVERLLAAHGLRASTYSALQVTLEHPGVSPSVLAQNLAIERPNMTQIIDELVNRGLLKRGRAANDGRAYCLTCTEAGSALARAAHHDLRYFEETVIGDLPPTDCARLIALLQEVERRVTAVEEDGRRATKAKAP